MRGESRCQAVSSFNTGTFYLEVVSLIYDRAFADFIFGSLILHFFCINFIN